MAADKTEKGKSLFEASCEADISKQPLAFRMRPRTLDEYVGQDHIIGPGRLLRRAIQADQLSSVIFYGPPGTGKTTLARVIANTTKSHFSTLNAVLSGVKELRFEIDEARARLEHYGKRTILFVDEVHRWNKSQQDALLPWVENGTIILIGATTENPFFEVNAALVSRSRIFQLVQLTSDDLFKIAKQAVEDSERGYGKLKIEFTEGSLEHLVDVANGDARSLLNALELAVETTVPDGRGVIVINRSVAEESIQRKVVLYDKEGDYHFDTISAFIKSLRGSDPDAALYWLARMVSAGEDPRFIFRRMLISACEDVGLADPDAIRVVEADAAAYERIGLPEGQFHLAHAALYLSTAPKSNSALAYFDALKVVESEKAEVPNHLKDASRDAKGFGHGEGYMYPHAYHDHWVAQQYLPSTLQGKIFYHPSNMGYEGTIKNEVERKRAVQLESVDVDESGEAFTYSPADRGQKRWIERTMSGRSEVLTEIADALFSGLKIKRSDRVLILNAGSGYLLWKAYSLVPEGLVAAMCRTQAQVDYIRHYSDSLDEFKRPLIVLGNDPDVLEPELKFEFVIGRNVDLGNIGKIRSRLAGGGVIAVAQTVENGTENLEKCLKDDGLTYSVSVLKSHVVKDEKSVDLSTAIVVVN